jgi:hypothetical protein
LLQLLLEEWGDAHLVLQGVQSFLEDTGILVDLDQSRVDHLLPPPLLPFPFLIVPQCLLVVLPLKLIIGFLGGHGHMVQGGRGRWL